MQTMNEPRARRIQVQLDHHFLNDIGVSVATPEPTWWKERAEHYGSLAVLGWAWPQPNPEAEWDDSKHRIIVAYCPEIIDEQTAELSSDELNAYITLIQYVCDLHIQYWDEIPDDEERHLLVDAEVKADMPVLHRLLHEALGLAALRQAFE